MLPLSFNIDSKVLIKFYSWISDGPTKHRKAHMETRDHRGPFRHKS